jgi:hypothetical protein
MRMSMNTALSASGRVDDIKGHQHDPFRSDWDIKSHPQSEIRGLTKLVKITEDVRKYAAEHGIEESAAIERGLREKAEEFQNAGAEIYSKP